MELINVIVVTPDDCSIDIRTFANIDEQDTSGIEAAEEAYLEEIEKVMPGIFDDEDDNWNQGKLNEDAALYDGHFSRNGYEFYIIHSSIENLQV